MGLLARGLGIALAQRDELFGHALGFFGAGPGGADGFGFDEGGDQVAEEGHAVGGFAAEMPVLDRGHLGKRGGERGGWCLGMGRVG